MKLSKWQLGGPALLILGAMQGCGGGAPNLGAQDSETLNCGAKKKSNTCTGITSNREKWCTWKCTDHSFPLFWNSPYAGDVSSLSFANSA